MMRMSGVLWWRLPAHPSLKLRTAPWPASLSRVLVYCGPKLLHSTMHLSIEGPDWVDSRRPHPVKSAQMGSVRAIDLANVGEDMAEIDTGEFAFPWPNFAQAKLSPYRSTCHLRRPRMARCWPSLANILRVCVWGAMLRCGDAVWCGTSSVSSCASILRLSIRLARNG